MVTGLGTGFSAVFLLVVLAGLALLLSLATAGAIWRHRRTGRIPRALRYGVIVLIVEVIGVSVVGLVWSLGTAPVVTAMIATLVLLPLVAIAFRARKTTSLPRGRLVATVAMAWGPPFLLGLAVFIGIIGAADVVVGAGSAGEGLVGFGLFAAMASGVVVVIGVGWLTSKLWEHHLPPEEDEEDEE